MDFKRHFEITWKLTLQFIAPLILMTLILSIVTLLSFGILMPVVMAGYFHAILLIVREGRKPQVQDLFSQMRLFLPLFVFSVAVFFAVMTGFLFLVVPGILIALAVSYFCLYLLPLMTDRNLPIMEAIRASYALTTKGPVTDQIVVFILFVGISALGGSVFIALLFTQPLATIFLMSVYEELTASQDPTPGHPVMRFE